MTSGLAPGSESPGPASRGRLELLTALIDGPTFDPALRPDVISVPADHRVYRWSCRVIGCQRHRTSAWILCAAHAKQWKAARPAGVSRADFLRNAEPLARLASVELFGPVPCEICPQRPAMWGRLPRLCARHSQNWRAKKRTGSSYEEWFAAQEPFEGYGECGVLACLDLACSPLGLCEKHGRRYRAQGRPGGAALPPQWFRLYEHHGLTVPVLIDDEAAFGDWCRRTTPMPRVGQVNLRGLAPLLRAEIKWGLFVHGQRDRFSGWSLHWVQWLVDDECRDLASVTEVDVDRCVRHTSRMIALEMIHALQLVYVGPAQTRELGYIEADHFGVRLTDRGSRFDLSRVTQRWLRELLWDYIAERLRDPHGPRSGSPYDSLRRACVELSAFLELQAPAGGHDPAVLDAEHMHAYVAGLRHRVRNGLASLGVYRADGKPSVLTESAAQFCLVYGRKLLRWALENGEIDRIGLDRGFVVAAPGGGPARNRTRSPFTDEVAWALAEEGNLRQFAADFDPNDRGLRDIWETIIVTGRRCREVIDLRLDCIGRYNGLPLLWHDQTKVGNYDQAVRIPEYLYQRLQRRQHATTAWFEAHHGHSPSVGDREQMALFPSNTRNPKGDKALSYHFFHNAFRRWVNGLDLGSCVPHQARHTLATKLLAHGAGLHHIKRFLGHVSVQMAEHYAKVAISEIEDVLQHVWVTGPGASVPGTLVSSPAPPLERQQAESLVVDLSRTSTPAEGGFCTYQPVIQGESCPWNLDCTNCDKFVMSGADLLYWRRKREQWASIAERAPDDTTANYLHEVFAPTGAAIDGLEKALAGLGLLDEALALDLRRPQDYFHRIWSTSFRATDLTDAGRTEGQEGT